jgi:serine protease Do
MPRIPAVPRVRSWNGDNNFSISPDMESAYNDYSFAFDGFPRKQKLGLKIQDTEEGNGVKVLLVEDSSAAAIAGLKKDDVIIEIGGEKVTNTDEARDQLQENREKSTYVIKARRNNTEMKFDIKIPKKLKTANL